MGLHVFMIHMCVYMQNTSNAHQRSQSLMCDVYSIHTRSLVSKPERIMVQSTLLPISCISLLSEVINLYLSFLNSILCRMLGDLACNDHR